MRILDELKEAWNELRRTRNQRVKQRVLYEIAQRFNLVHTYARPPGMWMCPRCNTVHAAFDLSVWDGLHFPACCGFDAGHRLNKEHATDVNYKLEWNDNA